MKTNIYIEKTMTIIGGRGEKGRKLAAEEEVKLTANRQAD